MNDKYYTPSIEEFHVGFEYELKDEYISESQRLIDWYSQIVNSVQELESVEFEMQRNSVRVKYLDSEDIESLGFVFTGKSIDKWFKLDGSFDIGGWTSYKIVLHFNELDHRVFIYADDRGSEEVLFNGIIKNKSELVRLLKQLNITK